jgi:hypothetical protein
MTMFGRFRAEVLGVLMAELPDVPLWGTLPDDVNELPCVVVGRPGGRQGRERVVFDLSLQVFVIGRRQQAGASEDELVALADSVFVALGGTRGTKTSGGEVVACTRVDPRMLTIAGQECPAYTVEVEASATTC